MMFQCPLAIVAAVALSTLTSDLTLAQPSVPAPSHSSEAAFPDRSFRLYARDSGDVDGDIIRVEVKDRTNPRNNRVIADSIRLDSAYGPAVDFSLAQPVNASIIITVIQDSDNPEYRGRSGVSMTLKIEDMLEGLTWEDKYEQFARTATINLNLDAVAVAPDGTPQPQWVGLTRQEYARWLRELGGNRDSRSRMTPEDAAALADRIVEQARMWEGSDTWAFGAFEWPYPWNTHKCNLFVHDVLCSASSCPPEVGNPRWWGPDRPPLAGEWGDAGISIPGFVIVDGSPQPGDVIAMKSSGPGYSGHVGIVVEFDPESGIGRTASVESGTGKVVVNDWGFRPGQRKNVVIRRAR